MMFEMNVVRFEAEDVIATSCLVAAPINACGHKNTKHLYIGPAFNNGEYDTFKVTQYDYKDGAYEWNPEVTEFSKSGMEKTVEHNNGEAIVTGQWYFKNGNFWELCDEAAMHQQ